jgi:hypothetical protein
VALRAVKLILILSPDVNASPALAKTEDCTSYTAPPVILKTVTAVPEKADVPVYFSNWIVEVPADGV